MPIDLILIACASLMAGFVDAIIGGGGLILLPALFSVFPSAPPATVFGTNKGGATWGTALAAFQYAKQVHLPWHALGPAVIAALVGSFSGAWAGHVWWTVAAVLAVANMTGSLLGTRLALKHGSGLIRRFFIAVVTLLILKTGYDAYLM